MLIEGVLSASDIQTKIFDRSIPAFGLEVTSIQPLDDGKVALQTSEGILPTIPWGDPVQRKLLLTATLIKESEEQPWKIDSVDIANHPDHDPFLFANDFIRLKVPTPYAMKEHQMIFRGEFRTFESERVIAKISDSKGEVISFELGRSEGDGNWQTIDRTFDVPSNLSGNLKVTIYGEWVQQPLANFSVAWPYRGVTD